MNSVLSRRERSVTHRPTICQVVHNLSVGGAELLAAAIARDLSDEFRFIFTCIDDRGPLADRLIADGFAVHVLHRRPGVDWSCSQRLRAVVGQERVSLIHAHQYTPFFYAGLSRFARRGPPILFTEHGRWFPDVRSAKRVIANRLLLRKRDRAIGVGESVRQALIRNEGLAAERVGVVYNGVCIAPTPDRDSARHELGFAPEEAIVIQIARLDALKDHATALRAIARLRAKRPLVRLVLVGDGPERTRIESIVNELKLGDAVRLLGTRQDIPRLLAAADILLLTSVSEGIPLTILEGMAAGLPIVATDVGGVAEIVVADQTGLLSPSGDDEQIAAHLLRLIDDPKLRNRLGPAGRDRAVAAFSRERMISAYRSHYRQMCRA